MKTIGIIGFGSFGLFLAEKLDESYSVFGYSKAGRAGKWSASLRKVVSSDYLILSIPLEAYETVLPNIKPLIKSTTVIVDVCSVKEKPVQIIQKILPHQPIVVTHPLFGPESASESLEDHTLVMCPKVSSAKPYMDIKNFAQSLKLNVVEMSPIEHDKEMATVHGLTFFIAHSLKDMGLHTQKLTTPSFKKLLSLAQLEQHHSDELFFTIQKGNPYTAKTRAKFISEVEKLNKTIESDS